LFKILIAIVMDSFDFWSIVFKEHQSVKNQRKNYKNIINADFIKLL
jgi:hypothetical protein